MFQDTNGQFFKRHAKFCRIPGFHMGACFDCEYNTSLQLYILYMQLISGGLQKNCIIHNKNEHYNCLIMLLMSQCFIRRVSFILLLYCLIYKTEFSFLELIRFFT